MRQVAASTGIEVNEQQAETDVTGTEAVTAAMGIRTSSEDRGSVTVVMLAVITAVLVLTVSGLLLASAVLASHRARAAADLAALGAAGSLIRGEPAIAACQSAARVAEANHARVQQCDVLGQEVRLTVTVTAGVVGMGVAAARSRAGPGSVSTR